jgi:phosphoglycolate phosphatase-like HAD superfamily hydrolase
MNLEKYELIFLDFDGVIKESVMIKTDSFVELFKPYGEDIANKIRHHQVESGGMSRYEKIPLYFKWLNIYPSEDELDIVFNDFSKLVKDKVIKSLWVPGIVEFLKIHSGNIKYVIVSATPQKELQSICESLKIDHIFSKIYGSPSTKSELINRTISDYGVPLNLCVMIGDMQADIDAANNNKISFILRRHKFNKHIQNNSNFMEILDFKNFIK